MRAGCMMEIIDIAVNDALYYSADKRRVQLNRHRFQTFSTKILPINEVKLIKSYAGSA